MARKRYRLVEGSLVLGALGVFCTTLLFVQLSWQRIQYDQVAGSDFRRIKTAVFNAIGDSNAPDRFIFWNHSGPLNLPDPLAGTVLSEGVRADVFHQLRRRRNRRPIGLTKIEVSHPKGGTTYSYTAVNGRVVEQNIINDWRLDFSWAKNFIDVIWTSWT